MTGITVRVATEADAGAVGRMIDAMDVHYQGAGRTHGVGAAVEMVRRTMAAAEGTRYLLAFEGPHPVGIAAFAVLRPGHLLEGLLFLKDLFVVPEARSLGIGRKLMGALARLAQENSIRRIDLTTDASNTAAVKLYDTLGGKRQDKIMFRFAGEDLQRLARA